MLFKYGFFESKLSSTVLWKYFKQIAVANLFPSSFDFSMKNEI